jgi:hypothetical protein
MRLPMGIGEALAKGREDFWVWLSLGARRVGGSAASDHRRCIPKNRMADEGAADVRRSSVSLVATGGNTGCPSLLLDGTRGPFNGLPSDYGEDVTVPAAGEPRPWEAPPRHSVRVAVGWVCAALLAVVGAGSLLVGMSPALPCPPEGGQCGPDPTRFLVVGTLAVVLAFASAAYALRRSGKQRR